MRKEPRGLFNMPGTFSSTGEETFQTGFLQTDNIYQRLSRLILMCLAERYVDAHNPKTDLIYIHTYMWSEFRLKVEFHYGGLDFLFKCEQMMHL